jgi:hypothetical protein
MPKKLSRTITSVIGIVALLTYGKEGCVARTGVTGAVGVIGLDIFLQANDKVINPSNINKPGLIKIKINARF